MIPDHRRARQGGQAIVLIALMLTILIGMAAIAIDGSRAYALRRDLQAAVDSASLAAGDKYQQTGSWSSAEQAAAGIFATNLRLYGAPSCTGWGSPGAVAFTVTCTYSDGTVLTQTVQGLGPQGSQFTISAQRNLQLQFARILTNGTSPTLAAASTGNVNNLRYTPAIGALGQGGCGGTAGTAITLSGFGTLNVNGDVVANGSISVATGSLRVAGDIYAHCQSPVPGSVTNACYPSGASPACSYPDVAGATRSGFRLSDPNYPAPGPLGSSQVLPNGNSTLVIQSGVYAAPAVLNSGRCWFLSGGVYAFQAGAQNLGDFVSNELKPPDEPDPSDPTERASHQFWDTDNVGCSGGVQLTKVTAAHDVPTGIWSFVVTSVRNDVYNGFSYRRESAPSTCQQINLNNHFDAVQMTVSNVPGATSYNIYAGPPGGNGCGGPFGLADNLPVSGSVTNANTNPCPAFSGNGCSLGHESILLDDQLVPPFAPNGSGPGTTGSAPPDPETAPLAAGLPNQNPTRQAGARGDRANENNCDTLGGTYASCPAAVTPGAVVFYVAGGCLVTGSSSDTYVFSGYQYNWMSVYEPRTNPCATNTLSAQANSAFIGTVYAPAARFSVASPYIAEAPGTGGMMAASFAFSGTMPSITFSSIYAPVPPASRLTG